MNSLRIVTIGLTTAALCLSGPPTLPRSNWHIFQQENVLGTSFELKVAAPSEQVAARAETAALSEIARENSILSSWDAKSEFSRWFATRGEAVHVSPELLEVFATFDTWRSRTNGALDAAAEAVTRIWKSAASKGRVPTAEELAQAVDHVRQPHWKLDRAAGTATHLSSTPLAMNSFVKSYIMDHAADAALRVQGVTAVVVNIGGDLVIRGAGTEAVQIADPQSDAENSAPIDEVRVQDRAVATSGGYRRGFDIGRRHYSHIVDPRTGQPTGHILSATVISPVPADAGAMATAFCVLTPEESRQVAAAVPNTEFLLIAADGERVASKGWAGLQAVTAAPRSASFLAAKPAPAPAYAPPAAAPPEMELTVNFELAQIQGPYRRPYVAVWVEDKDKFPLKTLALWYQKERWLPELHAWYRDDRVRATAEGTEITGSIASATRSPGKYSVKWDGKDQAGKPVKPGKYTIIIEAAREHGTYQIMRHEMEWNGTPAQVDLGGNQEISSASIDYRKAAH